MSVHRKKNGTWFVQYRVPGEKNPRREYCGVGQSGEQQAKIRHAEIMLQKAMGKSICHQRDNVYLDTVAQSYINERKMRNASKKWLYEISLLLNNYILPSLTSKPVDSLTYADIVDFVERVWGPPRTFATRQRYLGYLKALFRFSVANGFSTNNPLEKWKKTKEARTHLQLTVRDLGRLVAHAPPHLAWAMMVEWELGTRPGPSELFRIRWTDVDFKGCLVHVRGTKNHAADRVIPISQDFRDRLVEKRLSAKSEYLIEYKGQPVKKVCYALRRAAERAKLGYRVRMYDIRHLFASTMLAGGADLAAVSKLLGHSTIVTTQEHYYHVLRGEMARAISTRPTLTVPALQEGHTQGHTPPVQKPKGTA